jgi:hypothetical protein
VTAVKRCPRCGQVKAADEFYRRRHGRQLSSYCRPCSRAAAREARDRRRQDRIVVAQLRAVDRARQRRRRTLGGRGGVDR